jgi:hypothetical protein
MTVLPVEPFAQNPVATLLLIGAMVIASYLYAALLRRRHSDERSRDQRLVSMVDNYGRSGLP